MIRRLMYRLGLRLLRGAHPIYWQHWRAVHVNRGLRIENAALRKRIAKFEGR